MSTHNIHVFVEKLEKYLSDTPLVYSYGYSYCITAEQKSPLYAMSNV